MTREEAIVAMINGEKIRNKCFYDNEYIDYDKHSFEFPFTHHYEDEEGYIRSCQLLALKGGYEIYKETLTFERIRKECEPMKHLLVNENGVKRLYLGFNRKGNLVADYHDGGSADEWYKDEVKDWTIEEYKE